MDDNEPTLFHASELGPITLHAPPHQLFPVKPHPDPVLVIKPDGVMYLGTSDRKVDDATREELLSLVHSLVEIMTGKHKGPSHG